MAWMGKLRLQCVKSYWISRFKFSSTAGSMNRKPTHSYAHNASTMPLISTTIGQLLNSQADLRPDAEAFVLPFQNIRKSFAQLKTDADNLAAGLISLGLTRGDRVGVWGPNSYEWILTQFATAKAGLILVNVNPAYKALELEYCLNKVQIKALITPDTSNGTNYYETFGEICPEIKNNSPKLFKRAPDLEHLILITQENYNGAKRFVDVSGIQCKESRSLLEKIEDRLQFDDPINIQFTSGTTGNPKGATLTHFGVINNANIMGRILEYIPEETKICSPVPLYHCFGSVLGTLCGIVHGVTVVIPDSRFNSNLTLKAITDEKCDVIYGVPTMYSDLVHHPDFVKYDTRSLRVAFFAGAPCPVELLKQVQEKMHVRHVIVGYGMTETSPLSHVSELDDPAEYAIRTVGKVIPHIEVKLTDQDGAVVPVGTKGEIHVRGHGTMRGYWQDEEKTNETLSPTGWLKSGDLGVMNEEGYLRIVGRVKDIIIRGGENIFPAEIEHLVHEHPSVAEAYVVGVPDERLGEEICCWVKVKKEVGEDELRQFCQKKLAGFKVPRYFIFLQPSESFPLTVSGKVQKFKMREQSVRLLKLEGLKGPFDS